MDKELGWTVVALLTATGALSFGYCLGFYKGNKKQINSIDYIDGYENGCRDMDKFWQGRLKKMGFLR